MPRKVKTQKKKPQKRKSPEFEGIKSMEKTMETGMKTIGNIAIASMGFGLAGVVISKI